MLRPTSALGVNPFTYHGHTLFRSYGASLQSSLTRVLPRALEYSSHPPVSVYGTGNGCSHLEAFLGTTVSTIPRAGRSHCRACQISVSCKADLPTLQPTSFEPQFPSVTSFNSMRPPIVQTNNRRYRNINRFAIVYPFRTRLRSRLTLR